MAFAYGGIAFADIKVAGLSGRRGLGVSLLQFSMEFHIPEYAPNGVVVRNTEIQVRASRDAGGDQYFLGVAHPERPWEFGTGKGISPHRQLFELRLASEQLFEVENLRQGHGLQFYLTVNALAYGESKATPQSESLPPLVVNLTAWSKLLTDLGGDNYVTIGIPVPPAISSLGDAIARFRKAHRALLDGHYDTVVAECRLAIDSAQAITGDNAEAESLYQAFQRDAGRWRTMTKLQREIFVGQAARHYAHLAHHSDGVGKVEAFSRDEALFILAVCAGVLSSAQRRSK